MIEAELDETLAVQNDAKPPNPLEQYNGFSQNPAVQGSSPVLTSQLESALQLQQILSKGKVNP
jgi:hypothetical protein